MARFSQRGITRVYYVPTIASATLVPTTAEVTAGTRLDTQLTEVNGFAFKNNPIQTPVISDSYTAQVPGEDTSDASSFKFWEDKTTNPISTVLAKNVNGYIVFFRRGIAGGAPAAGDKCDVWPITVAGNNPAYSAGNEASSYMVDFALTLPPGFEKTLT